MLPTLLFVGASGVGKFRIATAVAAAINCPSPVLEIDGLPLDACGTCRSCDRIARNVHVDVLRLEPDETDAIKIDVVRDVMERTGYRPFEGRRRVVIVREADAMLVASQNALLKSLEEPPPGTMFILTTAKPGALLPTVISRCVRLRFGRLTEAEIADVLEREHGWPARDAQSAAALADGSVGEALALNTEDLSLLREIAVQLLQHTAREPAVAARLHASGALVTSGRAERSREELKKILRFLASMLRDIELLRAGADVRTLANRLMARELGALTPAFSGPRARDGFASVDQALAALERNVGIKVVAEWLATRL